MSWNDFWNGDPQIARYYREAYELQQENADYIAWLSGAYVYEALCAVSPVMRAFAKSGTKPSQYVDQPYTQKNKRTNAERRYEAERDAALSRFGNIRSRINATARRKAEQNG
jgi:hypothetical protein